MSEDLESKEVQEVELLSRSDVPDGLGYSEYRRYLRFDFFYSCAYCTMSEAEGAAIRFTIDHYEPQTARPDLKDSYYNLLYACDHCNTRKGDRVVPDTAKADGFHFFRPDEDRFSENFVRSGIRVNALSTCGQFTIDALDLNRLYLRRLRELRNRIYDCDEMVAKGILALRRMKIDQFPPHIRSSALSAIRQAEETGLAIASAVDDVLRKNTQSQVLGDGDGDGDDKLYQKARRERLKDTEALYPGIWRARAQPSA